MDFVILTFYASWKVGNGNLSPLLNELLRNVTGEGCDCLTNEKEKAEELIIEKARFSVLEENAFP